MNHQQSNKITYTQSNEYKNMHHPSIQSDQVAVSHPTIPPSMPVRAQGKKHSNAHPKHLCYPPYTRFPTPLKTSPSITIIHSLTLTFLHSISSSQEAFTQANLPRDTALPPRHIDAILIRRRPVHIPHSTTTSPHGARSPFQALPSLQFSLESQSFLSLFIQSALCSPCGELSIAFAALQFIDRLEQFLDLVSGAGDVFLEGRVCLFLALDLQLEVFDGAVDVSDRTLRFVALGFLGFELGFQLLFC